jgi:predicted Zn-dependent protease
MSTLWLVGTGVVMAQTSCGPLPSGGYGPYDYRTDKSKLPVVEIHHFTPPVEALIRGQTGAIAGDLDYVLEKFPNHHRALIAMTRLAARMKTDQPAPSQYTVECHFDRALRFRQDDTVVRGLYALYLNSKGRRADAIQQLDIATTYAKDNPLTHKNLGLTYLELGETDRAVERAKAVEGLGLDAGELVQRLKAIGRWPQSSEPAATRGAASQAAARAD